MALSQLSKSSSAKVEAGQGRITVSLHGSQAIFAELASTYPLKLLSPRITTDGVAVVYVMSYGGGLVGGDCVELAIDVAGGSTLLSLSQGSTKVFKTRPGVRRASSRPASSVSPTVTSQTMMVNVQAGSTLLLLPDPVTCFQDANYLQKQTFHLVTGASAILLDWLTSGRKTLGEDWVFSRYHSQNEVFINKKRIVKDVLLLEEPQSPIANLPLRSLQDSLAPYSCYATVILCGPAVQNLVDALILAYDRITVYKQGGPADLIWSISAVDNGVCHVVRVAGKETEYVKNWLRNALQNLQNLVGIDVYRKAFV